MKFWINLILVWGCFGAEKSIQIGDHKVNFARPIVIPGQVNVESKVSTLFQLSLNKVCENISDKKIAESVVNDLPDDLSEIVLRKYIQDNGEKMIALYPLTLPHSSICMDKDCEQDYRDIELDLAHCLRRCEDEDDAFCHFSPYPIKNYLFYNLFTTSPPLYSSKYSPLDNFNHHNIKIINNKLVISFKGRFEVFDIDTGKNLLKFNFNFTGYGFVKLDILSDDKVISAYEDKLLVLNLNSNKEVLNVDLPFVVKDLSVIDEKTIALMSSQKVYIYSINGNEKYDINLGEATEYICTRGSTLAIFTKENNIVIWDLRLKKIDFKYRLQIGNYGALLKVEFIDNKTLLIYAISGDSLACKIYIIDLDRKQLLYRSKGNGKPIIFRKKHKNLHIYNGYGINRFLYFEGDNRSVGLNKRINTSFYYLSNGRILHCKSFFWCANFFKVYKLIDPISTFLKQFALKKLKKKKDFFCGSNIDDNFKLTSSGLFKLAFYLDSKFISQPKGIKNHLIMHSIKNQQSDCNSCTLL